MFSQKRIAPYLHIFTIMMICWSNDDDEDVNDEMNQFFRSLLKAK